MREILSLHLGQAGIGLGSACWELLSLEAQQYGENSLTEEMWTRLSGLQLAPRAVFMDSDSETGDMLRCSDLGQRLDSGQVLSGKEDAGGIYQTHRLNTIAQNSAESIRRMTETCSGLQGFAVFHSLAGGTGAALSELLLDYVKTEFPKAIILSVNVFPSDMKDESVITPYNACLSAFNLFERADISFLMDNKALSGIANSVFGICDPSYSFLNPIAAQAYSSLTATLRFPPSLDATLSEIIANYIDYPRFHSCLLNFSPFYSSFQPYCPVLSTNELCTGLFQQSAYLSTCKQLAGLCMSCGLHLRGSISPMKASIAANWLTTSGAVKYVNWTYERVKFGVVREAALVISENEVETGGETALGIVNSTAVREVYARITQQVKGLIGKRAFWHWYEREGVEIGEVEEAIYNINGLVEDYKEVETP